MYWIYKPKTTVAEVLTPFFPDPNDKDILHPEESEFLYQDCFDRINFLTKHFDITPIEVKSDEHANSLIADLLYINIASNEGIKAVSDVLRLVNDKHCVSHHHDCRHLVFKYAVCPACYFVSDRDVINFDDYCPKCRKVVEKLNLLLFNSFCGVCLRRRILFAYDAFCFIDFSTLSKYIDFVKIFL